MITVLGLGFVGLTTGLGFAKKGFRTYGFDVDQNRLNQLRNLNIPFHEPHLKEVLTETNNNTFFLTDDLESAIKESEAVFICVGTPSSDDGSADLKYIYSAIDQILDVKTDKFQVIITKSTVPPSTVSNKVIPYVNKKLESLPGRNIGFASNPEFLREGYCWEDFIEPDRIVIGVKDDDSKDLLDKIYKPFNAPIHYVSYNSAEFIKYLSNTLLSTLISYSNEMSMVAKSIGDIDVASAFRILHEDKRWFGEPASMAKYVYPGCGYGGYCLPKDTMALASISKDNGYEPKILDANLHVNATIQNFLIKDVANKVGTDKVIGILGLSFKPNSDDVRYSPSKTVIELLEENGYSKVIAYDPISNSVFKNEYPNLNVKYIDTLEETVNQADALIILTSWSEFLNKKDLIKEKTVFDYRYIY